MTVYYIVAAVLTAVGILFLTNNGDLLVPAIESKSAEEVAKYKEDFNVKKTKTIAGIIFIVSSIIIALAGYINKTYFSCITVAVVAILLAIVYNSFRLVNKK